MESKIIITHSNREKNSSYQKIGYGGKGDRKEGRKGGKIRLVGTWVGGCQELEGQGMAVVNGDRVLWVDGSDGSTAT